VWIKSNIYCSGRFSYERAIIIRDKGTAFVDSRIVLDNINNRLSYMPD
jgi:hypothetical protein